jgi:hypothetical protein
LLALTVSCKKVQAIELPKGLQEQQLSEWDVTSKSIPGTTLRLVFVKAPTRHKVESKDPSGQAVVTGTVVDPDIFDLQLWTKQVDQESFAKGIAPGAAYLSAICVGNLREAVCRTGDDALRIPLDSGDTVMIPVATVETAQLDDVIRQLTHTGSVHKAQHTRTYIVQKKVAKVTTKKQVAKKPIDDVFTIRLDLGKKVRKE